MSEITAITSEELKQAAGDVYPDMIAVEYCGREIMVRRTIGMSEMLEFVDAVAGACVDESGDYYPQFRDCMFRLYTIMYYTNIAPAGDLQEQYAFVYGTPLFDTIVNTVDSDQLNDIKSAINAKINYSVNANIRKFNAGMEQLLSFAQALNNSFGDISKDELSGAIKALSTVEKVDEQKLVDAIMASKKTSKKPLKRQTKKPADKPQLALVEPEPDEVTESED